MNTEKLKEFGFIRFLNSKELAEHNRDIGDIEKIFSNENLSEKDIADKICLSQGLEYIGVWGFFSDKGALWCHRDITIVDMKEFSTIPFLVKSKLFFNYASQATFEKFQVEDEMHSGNFYTPKEEAVKLMLEEGNII